MEGDGFPDADAPYWRRHHGIGHVWQARPWARQALIASYVVAFVLIVGAIVFSIVAGTF
jgi:hypothetical protein